MRPLGETRRHFWLAQRMVRLHRVDLAAAAATGALNQAEWAGMVHRSRGRRWAEGCERFLARGAAMRDLPEGCCNRDRFAALRASERAGQAEENP